MRTFCLATLVLCTSAACLPAQLMVATLPASRDATLYQDATGQSANDSGASLFLGDNAFGEARRTILAFDFSSVPTGARIVEAELQLTISQTASGGFVPLPVTMHRVTSPWNEGPTAVAGSGGSGGPAQPGDTTWLHADYPSTPWTNPGGDFVAAPSGVFDMPTSGVFSLNYSALMVLDVQLWVAGLVPNNGWLLKTDEAGVQVARRLHSRESTLVGVQPTLTISYLLPGHNATRGVGCMGSNGQQPTMSFLGTPVLGGTTTLRVTGGLPLQPIHLMLGGSLNVLAPRVLPNCYYELDLLWPLFFPARQLDLGGATDYVFPIPNDPALFGASFAFQSLIYDPLLPPYNITLSNGAMLVIG